MDKDDFRQLMYKYRNGSATEQERTLFLEHISSFDKELADQLDEEFTDASIPELGDAASGELIYDAIRLHVMEENVHPPHRRPVINLRRVWAAAASIIVLVAAGLYFWGPQQKNAIPSVTVTKADKQPGREGAILTLADGSLVLLDTIQRGVVALQGGATARVINGALVYDGSGKELVYNTMSTPKGRQFQLTLPDGTKVWLNAGSSIRYPTLFNDNKRPVEIAGEAYFEVVRDKRRPFQVKVGNRAAIEVLGTHFNVNAYDNESSLTTTLLEGSVRVQNNRGQLLLRPGQQVRFTSQNNLIGTADLEKVMAWKNGIFNFDNAELDDVMRQLERWYDIEVVYEKNIPDIRFVGEMTRDIPLSGVLLLLEKSKVHFRLEDGRKLIVTP